MSSNLDFTDFIIDVTGNSVGKQYDERGTT